MKKANPLRRVAPFAVLGAALSFSAWSLYFVARHLGAPIPVAVVVSTIFDGGAIYLADLGADHTREGDSGFGPRFAVFILAGASAWLNTLHAKYGGYPANSELLWAAPPIVAVIVYEFTVRFIHRKTLRSSGRIPSPLPQFDTMSWILFPVKTLRATAKIVEFRREVTTAVATGEPIPVSIPNPVRGFPNYGANPGTIGPNSRTVSVTRPNPALTGPNPADVRTWARAAGLPVGLKGPIPVDIHAKYRQALAAGQSAATGQGEPAPNSAGEFETEFAGSLGEFEPTAEPDGQGDGQGDTEPADGGQGDGQGDTEPGQGIPAPRSRSAMAITRGPGISLKEFQTLTANGQKWNGR